MVEIQQAIFNALKKDSDLLNLLGLASAAESDISKKFIVVPPDREAIFPVLHFWFPPTYLSSRNPGWEFRPIQFRAWAKDPGLITQQRICDRIQGILVNRFIPIEGMGQYSKFFYVGEAQIPQRIFEAYGYSLNLKLQNAIQNFTFGG